MKEEKKKSLEEIKNLKNELEVMKSRLKTIEEKNDNENKSLKDEIENLKKSLELINKKDKIVFNSSIMKENEFDLIKKVIESRVYKKVLSINKIYQATINGESSSKFHSKCDGISNTITLIKSAGNRRFGGFV